MKIHPHKRCDTEPGQVPPDQGGHYCGKTRQKQTISTLSSLQNSLLKSHKRKLVLFVQMVCWGGLFSIASIEPAISDETDSAAAGMSATTDSIDPLALESLPLLPAENAASQGRDESKSMPARAFDSASSQGGQATSSGDNPQAIVLLKRVLQQLVHGPAFHCKVRETVWTNDREVIGVGTYEQAGQGTGRYHLQVTMHDGSGRHRLQQISDGRLAWTRTEIASGITLRRVDVSRLDEWVGKSNASDLIAPRYTVGAWVELLSTIKRDYELDLVGATLEQETVWVIKGELRSRRRVDIMSRGDRTSWPMLFPTRVHIAIASRPSESTDVGTLLPLRFEFWSDPTSPTLGGLSSQESLENPDSGRRLITLIELYSFQPIIAPPVERFRFENQEAEVNFINETDRYIQMHGIQLTEREKLQLRR